VQNGQFGVYGQYGGNDLRFIPFAFLPTDPFHQKKEGIAVLAFWPFGGNNL
jgi:hypothetical protein